MRCLHTHAPGAGVDGNKLVCVHAVGHSGGRGAGWQALARGPHSGNHPSGAQGVAAAVGVTGVGQEVAHAAAVELDAGAGGVEQGK